MVDQALPPDSVGLAVRRCVSLVNGATADNARARGSQVAALLGQVPAVDGDGFSEVARTLNRCGARFIPAALADLADACALELAAGGGGEAWTFAMGEALGAAVLGGGGGEDGAGAVQFAVELGLRAGTWRVALAAVRSCLGGATEGARRRGLALLAACSPGAARAGGEAAVRQLDEMVEGLGTELCSPSCRCGVCEVRAASSRGWDAGGGGEEGEGEDVEVEELPWKRSEREVVLVGRKVVLKQRPNPEGPTKNTGLVLWGASLLLGWWLEAGGGWGKGGLRGKRVIELGAGLGLNAISCALLGADVTATDGDPEVVALAEENVASALGGDPAAEGAGRVRCALLPWGEAVSGKDLVASGYDCILASDVLYFHRVHNELMSTLLALMGGWGGPSSPPPVAALLAHTFRNRSVEEGFLARLGREGIRVRDITAAALAVAPEGASSLVPQATHLFSLERIAPQT